MILPKWVGVKGCLELFRKFISFGSVIRPQPTCSISWIGGLHIGLPLDKHSLFSQNNSIKIKCALLKRCDAKRLSYKNVQKSDCNFHQMASNVEFRHHIVTDFCSHQNCRATQTLPNT